MSTTNPLAIDDLVKPVSRKNMGGLQIIGYYAIHEEVETWPQLPDTTTDMADSAKLVGNFVMKAGCKFHAIYTTMEAAEVKDEEQGEFDGGSWKHILEIFHPGLKKKVLGFMAGTTNEDLVFVWPDAEGQNRVVGSYQFPAKREGSSATTGKKTADRKGATLMWSSYGNTPAPVYEGTVPLTPATGSGSGS